MFELLFCSLFTIVPDYLYRRFAQGKRLGREINLFSVWYELRWGITGCFILTVLLITMVFYYHPTSTLVSSYFRTVTILPDSPGRVTEVHVRTGDVVQAGDLIFTLDDRLQQAEVDAAREQVAELDAERAVAMSDLAAAKAAVEQARSALKQAQDELDRNVALRERNRDVVAAQTIDRLTNATAERQGALNAASASQQSVETRIETLLPTQKASAEAALREAMVRLDQRRITASVTGRLEQFQLRPGDVVNPFVRPAGILVPEQQEDGMFIAGFGQLAAQVVRPGMLAEIACATQPFEIVPMVVDSVQPVIAAGQFRPSDQLLDAQDRAARPGTLTVRLRELYKGQAAAFPQGSACIANVYTNNHERLQDPDVGLGERIGLHTIDTVGIIHAILLRLQVVLLPVKQLVFTGEH